MPFERKSNLPRRDRHHYQGHAVVFWTNTVEGRTTGWLSEAFQSTFREVMLHASIRYGVWCPAYCLMPDHLHLLWMGIRRSSDQIVAMKFLRAELSPMLGAGNSWQHQAHDHVLRDEERQRSAFASICCYVLQNPVRAGLSASPAEWRFSGAIVPGFPRMDPHKEGYWELFWRLHAVERTRGEPTGEGSDWGSPEARLGDSDQSVPPPT